MAQRKRSPRRNATRPAQTLSAPQVAAAHGAAAPQEASTPRPADAATSVAALERALADAGEPSLTDDVLAGALEAVRGSRHPMEAEVAVAELLASIAEGVALAADAEAATAPGGEGHEHEDDDELTHHLDALLALLVEAAERDSSGDAAGLLRVLSTLLAGPAAAATAAASDRLVAAGTSLPRWAELAGQPRAVRAWSYRDVLGVQESVTVEFAYAHRPHAVSVLVDHELGGGVKDVWFAAGRDVDGLRSGYAQAVASEEITEVVDLPLGEAATVLRRALEHEPCPEQDDQVDDVVRFLPLLRSRVAHLERGQEPLQG